MFLQNKKDYWKNMVQQHIDVCLRFFFFMYDGVGNAKNSGPTITHSLMHVWWSRDTENDHGKYVFTIHKQEKKFSDNNSVKKLKKVFEEQYWVQSNFSFFNVGFTFRVPFSEKVKSNFLSIAAMQISINNFFILLFLFYVPLLSLFFGLPNSNHFWFIVTLTPFISLALTLFS